MRQIDMPRLHLPVLALVLLVFSPGILIGQLVEAAQTVNLPQTVMHGPDIAQVDTLSGGLQIKIPVHKMPGRGIDTDIELTYSSKLWSSEPLVINYVDNYSTTSWLVKGNVGVLGSPGWSLGQSQMGYMGPGYGYDPFGYYFLPLSSWVRLDGSSTTLVSHLGFLGYTDECGLCYDPGPLAPYWSIDHSYMKQLNHGSALGVKYKDGTQAYAEGSIGQYGGYDSLVTTLEDTNGNFIKCSIAGCTDTLNRNFTFDVDSTGLIHHVTYLDTDGQSRQVTFGYTNRQIIYPYLLPATGFSCPSDFQVVGGSGTGTGYQSGCVYSTIGSTGMTANLLTSITYANGDTYSFEYWTNPDGITTSGEVSKIIFPGGGYFRYSYTNGPEERLRTCQVMSDTPGNCYTGRPENRIISDRWDSADGASSSEKHWHYTIRNFNNDVPGTVTTTVTKPDLATDSYQYQDTDPSTGLDSITPIIPFLLKTERRDPSGKLVVSETNQPGYDTSQYNIT